MGQIMTGHRWLLGGRHGRLHPPRFLVFAKGHDLICYPAEEVEIFHPEAMTRKVPTCQLSSSETV